MRPGFFVAPAILLPLLGNTSMGPANEEQFHIGRDIYNEGVGRDPISLRLGEGSWQPASGTLTCRACHGEAGEGSSEGGIVAPGLSPSRGDQPIATGWLGDAIVRHRGRNGQKLGDAMPLYRMTERDLAALSAYVVRLPDVPIRGVTSRTITIGVNVAGASLTSSGRRRLAETVETLAASVNDEGGVYGRAIRFEVLDGGQKETTDALIRLAWMATAYTPPLTLVIQSDGETEASCGSVDPTREQMAIAVADAIKVAGRVPQIIGGVPDPGSSVTGDAIILSRIDGWADQVLAAEQIYLSPELAAELQPRTAQARIHVVVPGDISMRVAVAKNLLEAGMEEPRDAMVSAVYQEAIDVVLEVLRTNGRRVYPYATCDAVKRLASARQKVSVINSGGVKTIPAFSNNGS